MNSYGDPSSARGESEAPGSAAGYGSAADWPGNGGYSAGGSGRASAPSGRASASVPSGRAGRASAAVPSGRASAAVPPAGAPSGRASAAVPSGAGRASAAVPPGRASVGAAPAGRASVGAAAGRAGVGRASVRPVSPAPGGPPFGGGGPGGPGGRPPRRGGGADGIPPSPTAAAKAKRRRRINLIIGAFAILIMLAGGVVVGVTYYSTTVVLPNDFASKLELSSNVVYNDGKHEIAKLGKVNRVYANIDQIPEWVQHAVASAEDRNFYQHQGIDYIGIARAGWNNLTGGSQQGASTITQQYARNAMKMTEVSYARKAKEAVLASKLNDQYGKPQIMEFYLNTIYFGRGAYSIESASQAYFGKSVSKLNVAEAAVLAAVIKQPVPEQGGHKGYDPALNPVDAKDRWNYVLDGMAEKGWLPPGTNRATLAYPKVLPWDDTKVCGLECGLNTPAGNVINYVTQELAEMGLCDPGHCMEKIRTSGLKITTSIDYKMQKAAEQAASRRIKSSELNGQRKNLMAAMVAISPKDGRVMAYYGGEKSTDIDYAGFNWQNGKLTGGRPPGSSFKIYTLLAALRGGISMQSHWDGRAIKEGPYAGVSNATRTGDADCGKWCTLDYSTVQSYNVPFFNITRKVGVREVLKAAYDTGITTMWDNNPSPHEVKDLIGSEEKARSVFDYYVGFGQYAVTVLEHANGIATLAARGRYNKAHFVVRVEQKNRQTGKYEIVGGEKIRGKQVIDQNVVDDLTATLEKVPGHGNDNLKDGRKSAGKTGTWQLGDSPKEINHNGDAWMVGYTPQLATAVWVGNGNVPKRQALLTPDGQDIYGSMLPAEIWKRFMNKALDGKEKLDFPDPPHIGDDNAGDGESPAPKNPPDDKKCLLGPLFCPDGNNNGGNNNGGNDNGGNNDGGGGNNDGGDTQPTGPALPPDPNFPNQQN